MNPSLQNEFYFYGRPAAKCFPASFFRTPWAILLWVFFLGCAAVSPVRKEPVKEEVPPVALPLPEERVIEEDQFAAFPNKYRQKATEFERKEELRRALLAWEVVHSFWPDDLEAAEKIKTLEVRIRSESARHFQRGLEYLQKNSHQAARKEFLLALSLDPDHEQALNYLKHKLNETDFILYETKEGDTIEKIAQKIYRDPDKGFLVAYLNDLSSSDKLKSGMTLKLPIIEPVASVATARPVEADEMLNRARALFKAQKYDQSVSYAEKVLEYTPTNREAKDLKNSSYYQLGTRFFHKKEYGESLRMFKKVDLPYLNTKEMIAYLEKRLQGQKAKAENHYQKGVRHFLAEELDEAIKEWETTLHLDPQHPKAKKDIEQVYRLKEKLKKIQ